MTDSSKPDSKKKEETVVEPQKPVEPPKVLSQALDGIFGASETKNSSYFNPFLASKEARASAPPVPKQASDLKLALSVVLVELAAADQHVTNSEINAIARGLNRLFGANATESKELISRAQQITGQLRGVSSYAATLKEELSLEQKTIVKEILSEIMEADGVVDGYEQYLVQKFSMMLGLPE